MIWRNLLKSHWEYHGNNLEHYKLLHWGKGLIERVLQIMHQQWLFWNSHIHYKKLKGLTQAHHDKIFSKVEELKWIDSMDLLPTA